MAPDPRSALSGLTVLVAGASRSPGRDVALAFASRGASVVLFDWNRLPLPARGPLVDPVVLLDLAAEVGALGGRALTLWGDIRSEADVSRAVAKAVETFGSLDVVFNAMQVPSLGVCLDPFEDEWDTLIDVNLKGAWLLAKWVVPELVRHSRGLLVTNAVGEATGESCLWGIDGLSRTLARGIEHQGVAVRALVSGDDPGVEVVRWTEDLLTLAS